MVHVVRCARYQSFFDNLCYICCILRYLTTSLGRCYPNFAHVFLPYSAILWLVLHTYAHRFSSREAFPSKGDSIFFAGCQYSLTWLAVSVLSSWLSRTEKSARSCTVYGGIDCFKSGIHVSENERLWANLQLIFCAAGMSQLQIQEEPPAKRVRLPSLQRKSLHSQWNGITGRKVRER